MGKKDPELIAAESAYKNAQDVGNRREEARWANVIGDIHKKKGEYCEALKWLRIDYQISSDYLLLKDRLPSCQTIGELYLCLQDFENALHYQKEHLELAKEAENLIEEQRATTQLGRTYHELFNKSEDAAAIHKAKLYFNSAMTLARSLKENPPDSKSTYLKEYIDAYNNVGMLEMDLENLEKAETILTRGLEICNEEEVSENDDGRSRLHHNLGFVYTKLRRWDNAREHIRKDIEICHKIGHRQGEAKGYINLGELFVKFQKYVDALSSYKKAFQLAKSMDDEFALARQVEDNIKIVKECAKVMEEIIKEEQNCKKLRRRWYSSKGTSGERKCMKQVMTSLDHLLEKSHVIAAWESHLKFAKLKKQVATEFCDKEKLADSYDAIGESYQQLRDFQKAHKWFTKSLDLYEVIGNLEGKAMVKINIGSVLDSVGDSEGALKIFEEAHRIAIQANKISLQLMALDNMHYCYMMRFDNVEEVRRLKHQIEDLKILANNEQGRHTTLGDSCSETDTEGNDSKSENRLADLGSLCGNESLPVDKHVSSVEEIEDDEALSSLFRCRKLRKLEKDGGGRVKRSSRKTSPKISDDSLGVPLTTVSRKRNRLVLSDDEEDAQCSNRRLKTTPLEDVATSNELKSRCNLDPAGDIQDLVPDLCKHDTSSCSLVNHEGSFCSHKSSPLVEAAHSNIKSLGDDKCGLRIKVEGISVCIELESRLFAGELDIEALKVQAACSYYLQLSSHQRSTGLLPIIGNLKFGERILTTNDALETILSDAQAGGSIEASIEGHVQKRLIKLYVDCCQRLSELPNLKLLMKLYNLQISEDEVIVSDCEVQDMSVVPLLEALSAQRTISMLNLSHNMLGNATMEKLKQALTLSGQKYGALVLDLHCNLFGPTALFQICECPVLFNRLEVLNISGNRLTDACGSYLFTILSNCKGLYSLNIERCSITSRTIQKVADALDSGSILSQLCIGYNNPVSNSSLANLLGKLAKLERFSDLSLDGIKLSKHALDSVCQLARSSCLSGLMLGATNIGSLQDGALKLTESLFHDTEELAKLNLSYCALRPKFFERFETFPAVLNILELNLIGNPITSEGGNALASLLANPECCLKLLLLNKCQLGLAGVIQIIKSLAENESLEELNLAGNFEQEVQHQPIEFDVPVKRDSEALNTEITKIQDPSNEQGREDCSNQLEVADSYENDSMIEGLESRLADTCSSQNQHIEELSAAIGHAKHLQLLDLSNNGFSAQVVDTFYTAWCSCTRVGIPHRHVNGESVHFSIKEKICCGVKPCCKN